MGEVDIPDSVDIDELDVEIEEEKKTVDVKQLNVEVKEEDKPATVTPVVTPEEPVIEAEKVTQGEPSVSSESEDEKPADNASDVDEPGKTKILQKTSSTVFF